MDNIELIKKIKQGNQESFNILVKQNLTMILNFVYRFVYDTDLAEDIAQETFIKIWKNIKKFDENKKFKTWMFTIAKNTAIDFIRKKRIIPFSSFEQDDETNNFVENIQDEKLSLLNEMIKKDNKTKLSKVLKNLNTKQQLVLYLYYYEEMNFREISEILNISTNTIKSQHLRGIKKLKKIMHPNQ